MALAIFGTASLTQVIPFASSASGETLGNARSQAAAITARLNYLGGQVSYLAEKYNQAQLALSQVNQQISSEQSQIAQTQAKITAIRSKLAQEAIDAYVTGGNLPEFSALLSENPTDSSVRQEYLNTVTNSQTDLIASFQAASQNLRQQEASLKSSQSQAVTAFANVSSAKAAAELAVSQEKAQLGSVNSTIASLVAQDQANQAQKAAAQARQIFFGNNSPSNNNSTSSSYAAPKPVNPVQSHSVISWAYSELGKQYVFGGSGPTIFDCSGLTSFIYAKVGIYLPHSAAAQYNDTTRVSISNLQPGDLVFYYSPISHVAIYVGGGKVIQALNEASPVELSNLYWAGVPVGAGRVS